MPGLKRLLYHSYTRMLRALWALRGGRRLVLMGRQFTWAPTTIVPTHRHMRLPQGGPRSHIVRYTDFVQMHACCQYLESLLHAPVVVDVGAYHGAYAVVLGKTAQEKGGRVIAIEPNPASRKVLEWNLRANQLCRVVSAEPVACSDADGRMTLSLLGDQSQLGNAASQQQIEVKVRTLASILEEHLVHRVDLLIIDVEGAELPALRGFPWDEVPVGKIFCELHPNEWCHFGYDGGEFLSFLKDYQLRCVDMYFQEYTDRIPTDRYLGPCWLVSACQGSPISTSRTGGRISSNGSSEHYRSRL